MSFSRIKQLLKQERGLDLSMYADSFLEKSLEQRMQATACASPDDYCAHLEQNPAEGKVFQASLHNHFSQFFRHPLTFAVLEGVILPELIQKKKQEQRSEIRIWSAGCAAGQEACSLAILLEEALGNSHPGLTYRIFATDRDEGQLEQAREGYYPAAALDNLSLKRTRTWFTPQAKGYRVRPALHQNLDFSTFDLLQQERGSPPTSIFGDFDLIMCCNVLIYYRPKTQNAILDRFEGCLARDGVLVTGEAEHGLALADHYRAVCPPAPVFRMNRR
jgi:chemotaxis methyl-accepting protein methylase